jgi:glycosyltransferase involved in cell wall biosynthesis
VGRQDVLARTLSSIAALDCSDFEIIVVDNRPTSATRLLVDRLAESASLRYVAEPRPGLAIARNTGVLAAQDAAFVAFTDDDVVVDSAWLSWLLAPFSDETVSVVTGLVLPLELTSPVQKRFELYSGFGKGVERETYDLVGNRADDRLLYPFWGGLFGSGNSMAFRRRCLIEVGGFDPALGAGTPTGGGEDIAAFSDVILRGGRLVYEPRSVCWHEHRCEDAALLRQVHSYGVGFTATLWRYLLRDRRFVVSAIRSIPVLARVLTRRRAERSQDVLPSDLARLEMQGRLAGPWRYEQSRHRARRLGAVRPFADRAVTLSTPSS